MGWKENIKSKLEYRLANKLCRICGNFALEGYKVCERCRLRQNERNRLHRKAHKEQGLCTQCALPALPGEAFCEKHKMIGLEKGRLNRERRRLAGICERCKNKALPNSSFCEKHKLQQNEKNMKARLQPGYKQRTKNAALKSNFGITLEDYGILLILQDNVCAICGTDSPGAKQYFAVDHNHETGEVRGLLCNKCNLILGSLENLQAPIESYIQYLEKHNKGGFKNVQSSNNQ